jgi:hypothetical protein
MPRKRLPVHIWGDAVTNRTPKRTPDEDEMLAFLRSIRKSEKEIADFRGRHQRQVGRAFPAVISAARRHLAFGVELPVIPNCLPPHFEHFRTCFIPSNSIPFWPPKGGAATANTLRSQSQPTGVAEEKGPGRTGRGRSGQSKPWGGSRAKCYSMAILTARAEALLA